MHPYATDFNPKRIWLIFIIAAASVLLSAGAIALYLPQTPLYFFIHPAITLIAFFSLYTGFNRWLWRLPIWQRIGWVDVPDLNGLWQGSLTTSYNERSQLHRVKIRIQQTWTEFSLYLEGEISYSHSLVASLRRHEDEGYRLSYEYIAQAKQGIIGEGFPHRGIAILHLRSDGDLEGRYYYEEPTGYIIGNMLLKRAVEL